MGRDLHVKFKCPFLDYISTVSKVIPVSKYGSIVWVTGSRSETTG